MFAFLNKCQNYFEYLPIMLVTLLFVAETEMENKAFSMSCQFSIMIICTVIFFMLVIKFRKNKWLAFAITGLAWVLLVFIKRKHINSIEMK